jgi:hypothetical protein
MAIYSNTTKRYLDVAEIFLKNVTWSELCAPICDPVLVLGHDWITCPGRKLILRVNGLMVSHLNID